MKKIFVILAVAALCASCGPRNTKPAETSEVDSTLVEVVDSVEVAADTVVVAE